MPYDFFPVLSVDDRRFITHYLREGGAPEIVHIAERKARLKAGAGKRILAKKSVQQVIQQRQMLVEFEENRLIAKDAIGLARQADERDRVTLHKIEQALDKVIALKAEDHGPIVLKGIELGLVYVGAIRDGNKVKVQTVDPLGTDKPDESEQAPREIGFYSSIFNGAPAGVAPAAAQGPEPAPLMPEDEKPVPPPTVPVVRQVPKPVPKPPPPPKKSTPEIEIT